ncbi:MAG: hypothetical protein WC046_04415 [Candidatus Bathyarchaeia archaeon]
MPLASFLGEILKSGKVTITANAIEALEINASDKKIDVKALDKDFIKGTIVAIKGTEDDKSIHQSIKNTVSQIKTARSSLNMLKGVAEELSSAGITVTLSYKDKVVVTLGSEANPKLSKVATGTRSIEINSARRLIELGM